MDFVASAGIRFIGAAHSSSTPLEDVAAACAAVSILVEKEAKVSLHPGETIASSYLSLSLQVGPPFVNLVTADAVSPPCGSPQGAGLWRSVAAAPPVPAFP